MLIRDGQPLGFHFDFATDENFNFAVDSPFTNFRGGNSGIVSNDFLLMDGEFFLLADGSNFLTMTP